MQDITAMNSYRSGQRSLIQRTDMSKSRSPSFSPSVRSKSPGPEMKRGNTFQNNFNKRNRILLNQNEVDIRSTMNEIIHDYPFT